MVRKKRVKRFGNGNEMKEAIDKLVGQVDRISQRTPRGVASLALDRCLTRAISALLDARGVLGDQSNDLRERESAQEKAAACARLRARGMPELPAHVNAEIRAMKRS